MKTCRQIIYAVCFLLTFFCQQVSAQNLIEDSALIRVDTIASGKPIKAKRNWTTWRPDAKRAMWLAIILPGAGQIYNRKFWKLPIIYGGFVGCAYAWSWNNQMYNDYKQAYLDIMDSDPNTKSYEEFIHHIKIDSSNLSYYQSVFSKRKDKFRRWRDLSIFCMIGVYAISIIDAYVDASLSEFDISPDLSMQVHPTYIDTSPTSSSNSSHNSFNTKQGAWGLQCCLRF